jgi:RNase H-fold protein (predicted Holliday junction resolvase)
MGRAADHRAGHRFLIETGMRRDKRKQRVDQTAAAILLQSYLDHASR